MIGMPKVIENLGNGLLEYWRVEIESLRVTGSVLKALQPKLAGA